MNTPAYIEFLGSAPGGNKISGKFPGPEFPDLVNVKGTADTLPLRGNSGIWISGDKYTTLNKTLVLKKAGLPDQEVTYDNIGMPVVNDAEASGFTVISSGGTVSFSWTTTKEISVTAYIIDRKPEGGVYEDGVAADFPDSRPLPKQYPDPASGNVISDTPGAGNFVYRLRARFENSSTKILAETGTITV